MKTIEICVHGNSGQIQDPGAKAMPHGWGIEYDVAGTGSWLQYSIPVEAGTKVKGVRIIFTKDGKQYKNGWIRHVHVYDAWSLKQKFDNLYLGKGSVNKTINKVFTLKKPTQFYYGIGVSILPETKVAGGLKAIVNFELHSVCAICEVE